MGEFCLFFPFCFAAISMENGTPKNATDEHLLPALQVLTYIIDAPLNSTEWRVLNSLKQALMDEAIISGASKYSGYSDSLVEFLVSNSNGMAREQLHAILSNLVKRNELKLNKSKTWVEKVLRLLEDNESAIYNALDGIPALPYN